MDLARAIAADGEGATKRVEVRVSGAASDELAEMQALDAQEEDRGSSIEDRAAAGAPACI